MRPLSGIGILKVTACAHFDDDPKGQQASEKTILDNVVTFPVCGLDETVCVIFQEGQIVRTESLRKEAFLRRFDKATNTWRVVT